MATYILYNSLAGNSTCKEKLKELEKHLSDKEHIQLSVTEIGGFAQFMKSLAAEDEVILCGGDGTINRFINDTADIEIRNTVLYYAAGSGNDFLHDLNMQDGAAPFPINDYIKSLPVITVNGKTSRFINAIGYGIDGYCCEVGDKLRASSPGKRVNYTPIAIKGALYGFAPRNATVIIDGTERHYKKVWLAPAMHGRFFGGGMMAAPAQDRCNADGTVSVVVGHDLTRLGILKMFPSIFTGKHVKYTKKVDIIQCHEATIRFDKPCALQIDGETVLNVSEYSVKSSGRVKQDSSVKDAVTV